MTLQEQIEKLLAEAEPLRELHEDDPRKAKLGRLVDEINGLRAEQEREAVRRMVYGELLAPNDGADAKTDAKRSPGRPKKADK